MTARLVTGVLVLGLVAVTLPNLTLRADVTSFLPDGEGDAGAAPARTLSRALAQSELPRGMVLSIGAADPRVAREVARQLTAELARDPEVAWARVGPDEGLVAELEAVYGPHRLGFLSDTPDDPERGVRALTRAEALASAARKLRATLSVPAGWMRGQRLARDPLGALDRILQRVRGTDPGLELREGQFVSRDGRQAIVLLQTRPGAFDTARQGPLLARIAARFERLAGERPGAGLVLEQSGVNRFATRIEQQMRTDAGRILAVSLLGVMALFLATLRSPGALILVLLPALVGGLGAACLGVWWTGGLDLLTVAFGASLAGVAIDYAIHLLLHHRLEPPDDRGARPARRIAQRLAIPLALGAGTTIASYAGLVLTDLPGFRRMGVFAMTGVLLAFVFTWGVLPMLMGPAPRTAPRLGGLALALGRGLLGLRSHRRLLATVPVGIGLLAAYALPRLEWSTDLRGLSQIDPALVAEDRRVRARLSQFDTSRVAIVRAPDEPTLLERSQALHGQLETAREKGALEGQRSLHALLWPARLQRRNLSLLRDDPGLEERLALALRTEGLRPEAFAPFLTSLRAPPAPPLSLAELRGSPLAALVGTFVIHEGAELAAVTYLRGVRDPSAVEAAVARVEGAQVFDQGAWIDGLFAEFRATTLRQIGVGSLLVLLVLALRYRRPAPVLAAFLPSAATALLVLSLLALGHSPANLLHAVSLLLVMGMGVDYGVFIVESEDDPARLGRTLVSLGLCAATTVFVFGALALSAHPALRAIGVTTALGVASSWLLAPLAWVVLMPAPASR